MARKSKKNTKLSPLTILLWMLSVIGKPVYFILSRIVIFFIFLVSVLIASIPKIRLEFLRINLKEIALAKKLFKSKKFRLRIRKRYILLIILVSSFLAFYLLILRGLPSPKNLYLRDQEVSTKIYDRNGNLLYKIYKDKNRTIIPLSQIPLQVRLATLAVEDAEFYNHAGFSIKGIFRSLIQNFQNDTLNGGSTITQQLVKNTLLTPEKTLLRKIKELVLAIEVENNFTKDQILEMYLNEVSYGGTAYGIAEASSAYFGKYVQELNLAESAMLAGLPKSPTIYSPFSGNPEVSFERQRDVLHLMRVNKFITKDQENEAINTPLSFVANKTEIQAPHFVMYIRKLLVDKYGDQMVEKGGLEVITSLDLSIQKMAENIVTQEVDKIKNLHVGNGSALVFNPVNGEILAMVGSKDYFDIKNDGNVNVLTRLRQPGSSIKMINYAYALSHGYTPSTIIDDSPITYSIAGSPPYSPKNYDGKFVGHVSLRSAFAQSRNIPAVKVLASYGVNKMIELAQEMGISTWNDPKNYGLSLTLGGGAITGVDLAKAYSVLANSGKAVDLNPILQVKDYKGKVIQIKTPRTNKQILDPRVAYQIIDILKDNYARSPEFGLNSYLVVKDHPEVAVKTGTSNDLRDNWTVGFNQNYLVLTWVGNNDNSPMSHIASGVTGASPIWNKIISSLLQDKPSVSWTIPYGLTKLDCRGKPEYFLNENIDPNFCKVLPTPTPSVQVPNIEDSKVKRRGPQIL